MLSGNICYNRTRSPARTPLVSNLLPAFDLTHGHETLGGRRRRWARALPYPVVGGEGGVFSVGCRRKGVCLSKGRGKAMGAILPPITGVQFNALLRHAITAMRVALRHRGVDLRSVRLHVGFHRDADQFGDHLVISPEAMIQFRELEAVQNDITPQAARPGGFGEADRQLRPWPFRWPSQDLPALASFAAPDPLPVPGQYIDILF